MEVQGTVKLVEETKEYGSNGFRKRLMVVATDEQYPQELPIEFVQDKVDLLDSVVEGESVTVSINLRGREHEGRWYPSIQGWRISSNNEEEAPKAKAKAKAPVENEEDDSDLPF